MTTDRHACGLSSFLPMSCRGRAEAFARRLQSRLQSLGRQPSDDPHESEESWLTTSQQAFPTSRQPRLSSSSESDIYFDFDCDFGSPESPQEEATEMIHLNRRRECGCILEGQDLESGCATASASATATATSPGSSESSDNNYYDPEAPLNDDLSALIDSTLQQSCTHVQCNGYEPACLDCGAGTGTVCFPHPDDCTVNGHAESQSNESKSSSSPCSSESGNTKMTNETRNETLNTFGSLVGLDVVDDAGLRHYCKRARKPRVDYTKCNGLRHEASHKTTETHEEKTKAHEAVTPAHEPETAAHEVETLTHESETKMRESESEKLEAKTKSHEEETEKGESEAAANETETNANETEAIINEEVASKNEPETEVPDAEIVTHKKEANKNEPETEVPDAETVTHEEEANKNEPETEVPEAETVTHEGEAIKNEPETEVPEAETVTHEEEANKNEPETELPEAETVTHEGEMKAHEEDAEPEEKVENSSESPESLSPPVYRSSMKFQSAEECCDDTFLSSLNILKRELLIECPTSVKSTVPDFKITEASPVAAEVAARKVARPEGASTQLDVDDDIEDDRPQRVRRCSSLKTGKTPPGTPGRKKIVRFADVLGLDLADVRTFLDEVPKVPNSAYDDLQDADLSLGSSTSMNAMAASMGCPLPKPEKLLVALFVQPGGCPDFLDRVREQLVCLENAVVNAMLGTIAGTVRVLNLDFHKSVHVRYTVDEWKTFSDLRATYVQNSCDGFSDTFSFTLYAHTLDMGQRLEFAVRFQCHGCQYWDSNRGTNYAFQCLPPAGQSPFRSQAMSTCPDEQWASFY